MQMPVGSTPVDFAFQVHTHIGMHCMGAKINHVVVPLNTKLKNGDVVEIITSKKKMPNFGWKKFIVTTKARNEINRFLRQEHDRESIKLGKEILTKTLRRLKTDNSYHEFQNSYKKFGYSDVDSLLRGIGTGIITVRDMFIKLRSKDDFNHKINNQNEKKFFNFSNSNKKGIILDGIDNLLVSLGKCCNPIPGDDLIGFVTRGRGLTVHQSSCKSLPLLNHESDRLVPIDWKIRSSDKFNVNLKVVGQDYKGWLKDTSECISKQNINISSVDINVNDSIAEAQFIVQIKNSRQLKRLMRKMTNLKFIHYVERAGR